MCDFEPGALACGRYAMRVWLVQRVTISSGPAGNGDIFSRDIYG
jgi:hypothetical protein